jgi:hypothetical protein
VVTLLMEELEETQLTDNLEEIPLMVLTIEV